MLGDMIPIMVELDLFSGRHVSIEKGKKKVNFR